MELLLSREASVFPRQLKKTPNRNPTNPQIFFTAFLVSAAVRFSTVRGEHEVMCGCCLDANEPKTGFVALLLQKGDWSLGCLFLPISITVITKTWCRRALRLAAALLGTHCPERAPWLWGTVWTMGGKAGHVGGTPTSEEVSLHPRLCCVPEPRLRQTRGSNGRSDPWA